MNTNSFQRIMIYLPVVNVSSLEEKVGIWAVGKRDQSRKFTAFMTDIDRKIYDQFVCSKFYSMTVPTDVDP